ncbi:restriction endonuclease subunit S [Clostridium sporogenes]|uniref:restriction endonuclease subunit S n=1 Tax=Clostridium TaxID=1485 RepID=UPI00196A1633|nr:restriction endonuclease subunit S [Clostridium sporogenes]
MKNTPKIRFKDYTDEWETRKLGEISEKVTEKNSDYEYTETLTNSAEFGIVSQRDFFKKDISNPEKTDGYYIVREGDFVYNPRISTFAPVGPINRNKLGKTGIMSPLYTVFRTSNINRQYLEYYFKSTKWHNFMYINGDTGARADRFAIKNSVFMELPIPYPKNEEQQRIGGFLNNLDNLVSFYQQECEQLQTFKKRMLKKMFPQEGCSKPEFRFDGFTDDWEQRKLGDISDVTKLAGFEFTEYVIYSDEGTIIALRGLNVKNGKIILDDVKYIDQSDFSKLNRSKLFKDDILFTYVGSVGELAIIPEDNKYYLAPNVARIRLKKEINSQFVIQMIGNKTYYDKVIFPLIATSSQPALSMENVRKFILKLPSFDEQTKIGEFFQHLDNLITLHQRKCDKLVEVKKYMLKNMFI